MADDRDGQREEEESKKPKNRVKQYRKREIWVQTREV
ncbi:uncharacterized protein G2W53_017359 [Senna tora]|uniref:Uncharacterized protein n=1 Tax=Senna tora TaxID=362788 RepID=A0A834TTX2_9FABA|nr:uncharacterized protein G2W53_017359 [Senna tora]